MNKDILQGTWLETMGRIKKKWGKLTDNDLGKSKGKSKKLFGRLQKKYVYMGDKIALEYKDSAELAKIINSIRGIHAKKEDITAISFITRYGRPLLAKNQKSKISVIDKKREYNADWYFDSRLSRRNTHMISQCVSSVLIFSIFLPQRASFVCAGPGIPYSQ